MTTPAIRAMARGMYEATPRNKPWSVEAQDAARRHKWETRASAALRALLDVEPSEAALRAGLIAFAHKVASRRGDVMPSSYQEQDAFHAGRLTHSTVETVEVWRAMLAELVKESGDGEAR